MAPFQVRSRCLRRTWDQMPRVLEAMKPGLVTEAESGDAPT
jgi:hypothetical protein